MAIISLADLCRVIKSNPEYEDRWHLGVAPEEALALRFEAPGPRPDTESIVYPVSDGSEIVLDIDADGTVWGLEIV